ncbi:MAG: M56 family peptidase [Cyanobacteria bacterium]|nr:M56 family peptidase [Cyanobacteriota bacterium]MDW8202657.1 M56 family peptidase [Cyanobacteriota bacterium SKYGB_h_bin112]
MMHGLMVIVVAVYCCWWRWYWLVSFSSKRSWGDRWQRALCAFLLPPLLLIMTAIAISLMGPQGQMVGFWEGWCCYSVALAFLGWASVLWLQLVWQGQQTLQRIRTYPLLTVSAQDASNQPCRLLDSPLLYSAQVGFWRPELVISQGMLTTLNPTQLAAVITHEQAHAYYQDTFWFFWLGWLRRLTCWLPYTNLLWQELLTLRELRADGWAAQRVDSLLLAEVLLAVVKSPWQESYEGTASFGECASVDRLTERMNALLAPSTQLPEATLQPWVWFCWVWWPLLVVPFHV